MLCFKMLMSIIHCPRSQQIPRLPDMKAVKFKTLGDSMKVMTDDLSPGCSCAANEEKEKQVWEHFEATGKIVTRAETLFKLSFEKRTWRSWRYDCLQSSTSEYIFTFWCLMWTRLQTWLKVDLERFCRRTIEQTVKRRQHMVFYSFLHLSRLYDCNQPLELFWHITVPILSLPPHSLAVKT